MKITFSDLKNRGIIQEKSTSVWIPSSDFILAINMGDGEPNPDTQIISSLEVDDELGTITPIYASRLSGYHSIVEFGIDESLNVNVYSKVML